MNIRSLLELGHAELRRQREESEVAKTGHPRIGSIGIVTPEGDIHGVCHRIALARSLGIEREADLSMDIMWKAGESNEWHWERILKAAIESPLPFEGDRPVKVLTHDQVAVRQKIEGVPLEVLGHPDVVLEYADGRQVGLELKGIFGLSTAVSVELDHRPKNENLIQAAGYSYFRNIPYRLCYTLASWVKYGHRHIKPLYHIFDMEWRDDVLYYRSEFDTKWTRTSITPTAIQDYYRLQEEMKQSKTLGPRVNASYVDGTNNKYGKEGQCGLCEFRDICDNYEDDYDAWVDAAKAEFLRQP